MKKLMISRKDLKNNLKVVRKIVNANGKDDNGKFPRIIAVVKGNGMGLGLSQYAKILVNNGIDFLAVANTEEAILLREAGIEAEILMMTPVSNEKEIEKLVENNITITISMEKQLENVEKLLQLLDKTAKVHIKIDTGFGRYGFLYSDFEKILTVFKMCDKVKIEGMYTHFAKPMDEKFTRKQFNRFIKVAQFLKENGQTLGILHCSESTAILKYPMMNLNAVRLRFDIAGKDISKSR